MRLIANLEDTFDIMLEMDDIIDFSSFAKGKGNPAQIRCGALRSAQPDAIAAY